MMMDLASKLSPNVESRNFISFCLPSKAQVEDKGELNEWLECMMFLFEDIKWLLSLNVDKFWNQVIYDESWAVCFDSFLQHAPRTYDLNNIPDVCKVPLNKVGRLILLCIKRLSLYDEDINLQFSPDTFGEIIYESYVFDAAKLLDIAGIYNKTDVSLLSEIFDNIFNCQPKYFGDISHAINSMIDTISNIDERISVTQNGSKDEDAKPITGREAQDIVLFLYDMAKALQIFAEIFPRSSHVFFKALVISKLATFTEISLPSLLELIEVDRKRYKYMCNEIEKCFLSFVSIVVQHGFVKRGKCTIGDDEDLSSEFVSSMDAIAQCPKFLSGYFSFGNVEADFLTIQKRELLDNSSLEYCKNMLGTIVIENDSDQVIKELMDILPGKSAAFINKCIETYGPKVDVIMNNIIEGNIIDENEIIPVEKKPIVVPNKDVLEDNKETVALFKATYLLEESDDEPSYDLYDDEYDDTYDSHNVGATDIDDLEELTSRRKFTIPAALRQLGDVSSESEEDGEEDAPGGDEDQNKTSPNMPDNNGSNRGSSNQRGNQRGRGNSRGGRGNRGRGGPGGPGRGGQGNNNSGNSNGGGNQNNSGNNRGNGANRGRGRGNGRAGQHRRRLGDKKRSQGMMPF